MTTIGTVTVDIVTVYTRRGYGLSLVVVDDGSARFNQLRELWAKSDVGTAVHMVPGERLYGEDLTADSIHTVYCDFTVGTPGKVQDGYYLLRPQFSFVEDETPEGHSYAASFNLFFLGTTAYYQAAYGLVDLEALDSDWGL